MEEEFRRQEQVANLYAYTSESSRRFNFTCYDDDDDEERTIPLSETISQLPPSIVITISLLALPIEDPEDSLIMENEELSTILEKELDEVIKSNVEDLVSIISLNAQEKYKNMIHSACSHVLSSLSSSPLLNLPLFLCLNVEMISLSSMFEEFHRQKLAANLIVHTPEPPQERTIPLSETISQLPSSIVITISLLALPIKDPEDSLIMETEELSTILEKESDEVIKSNVEDLVSIIKGKFVTSSNPLFDSNDDFTSGDDESLSDEDVLDDNVKIYSNPLFEFDDEYISSDVNPLFDEVLDDIKSKDSYNSNIDEPALLVTPLYVSNKDKCFDPGGDDDEINVLDYEDGYYDSERDILYLESFLNDDLVHRDLSISAMSVAFILKGFTDEPPLEENDELFDLEPKNDEWKKILHDDSIDDLMTEDKDCPDYEDSRAHGFCPSFTQSLILSLLIYANPIS
nr:hypothetical protein [Tanacetum cinerariifolium]